LSVMQYLDVAAPADADAAPPGGIDDGLALREVLVMHYESLKRRLVRKLGCPDLASDCLHDAWLRLGEFTAPVPTRSPQAYVYRVACNAAIDRLRGARARRMVSMEEVDLDALADATPGPYEIAEQRSEVLALDRALRALPRRHRAVLVALRIEERTREEVADWLQMSLRSVDTTLRQALDHCAEVSGQKVCVGVSGPRRHWRADAEVRR
ncbi:MAG: RNA polymerase sigma factor, partial [Blastomonas fulva]